MKKSIISLGLMLSAMFTLTNCAKELDAPVETPEQEGISYELIASVDDPSTKTVNEGLSTKWVANDALNVFYAEAGTTAYSANCKFTVSDIAAGRFTGNLDTAKPLAASNDWYVLYPYNSHITTPANTSAGWTIVGAEKAQKQVGLDNMSHISGENCPIYGVVNGSSSQEIPSIRMKHIASVLKVVVKNNSGAELPVTSIKFTAPELISGKFYMDITKEPVVFTSNNYGVEKTASLDVVNATIPVNGSAAFYLALKPFKATAQDLVIEVNGYAKTIKSATTTFTSGKIKTLNFNYDQKPPIYSTGFDYTYDSKTQYNKPDEVVGIDSGSTTSWGITYGNWNGDNSAQMRTYADDPAGEKGSLYMKFDVSGATKVTYNAKSDKDNLSLNTYYSVDSGLTWTAVDTDKPLTSSMDTYTMTIPGNLEKVRVKFSANIRATGIKGQLTIDDVKIFGEGQVVADNNILVDQQTLTLDYKGGAKNVVVTSNAAWIAEFVKDASLTTDPSVIITPNSGNASNAFNQHETIAISAAGNTAPEKLSLGTIKFIDTKSQQVKATVVLEQEGRPANGVSVDNANVTLASGINTEAVVNVTCNWAWEATISTGSGFKIASDPVANTITITSTVESGAQGTILVKDLDNPAKTAEITVSQAAAGSNPFVEVNTFNDVKGQLDANISFEARQGTAKNPPALNGGVIRVYQNGGEFNVSSPTGKIITEIVLGSAMKTKVTYDGVTTDQPIEKNGKLTVSGLNTTSLTFKCTGTSKTSRLYVNYLKVTYKN